MDLVFHISEDGSEIELGQDILAVITDWLWEKYDIYRTRSCHAIHEANRERHFHLHTG